MTPKSRLATQYVIASLVIFTAISALSAQLMIRLISWYLSNCGTDLSCQSAGWLIDYWWLIYVPIIVGFGGFMGTRYLRRLSRLDHTM